MESMRRTSIVTLVVIGFALWSAPAALAVSTTRVSKSTNGTQGDGDSERASISADGRFVAFESNATNLVSGDSNNEGDVFVRDRQTGQTTRVSKSTNGTEGNGPSGQPAISADGRFVAFASGAINLVAGDSGTNDDIFVRDRQTGQTTRVSKATNGTPGNDDSNGPSLSADGRFVAFASDASNLVAGDSTGFQDIFVRDLQTGQTTRVSKSTNGAQGNNHSTGAPSISADGRFVAFNSQATNLVSGDTNSQTDVFVRDRQTGQTTRVSKATDGAEGNGASGNPAISADGRFVAFDSQADNLVAGDTIVARDVFVRDRQTGETTRLSKSTSGAQGNDDSEVASISSDGRFVAFESEATNFVGGDTNSQFDIFLRDRQTGQTTKVSKANDGSEAMGGGSFGASVSADGRFVAFDSAATNLVNNDTNGKHDVFVRDRQ